MAKNLPSGTTARAVPEWKGRTPNTKAPLNVQLRILERQHGKCALTDYRFMPGDKKRLDHVKPLADGGENREGNLQWVLADPHLAKTAAEAKQRAKDRAKARSHASITAPPSRPLQGRPFPEGAQAAKRTKKKLPPPTHMPTELERRYGIVEKPRRR